MEKRRKRSVWISVLVPVLFIAAILSAVWLAADKTSQSTDRQQYEQTVKSLERAVTSCYAIEGRYPPSVEYMEKKYGVIVDYEKYLVVYDVFASNVRPSVQVMELGNGDEGIQS